MRAFAQGAIGRLLSVLNGAGEETRVVGGAVRNLLLGLPVNDIDCATTATPDIVMARAAAAGFRTVPTGLAHGTVTVIVGETPFEVTTLRRDVATDGRHAVVAFGRDFRADAARRDFTVNALSATIDGDVHDYFGGLDDLATRRIRFIGDAAMRIREDYLRILRLFRFHAFYGSGPVDADALHAAIAARDGLAHLSRERVRAEFLKLLVAPAAADTVTVMSQSGILERVLGGIGNPVRLRFARPEQTPAQRLALLAVETSADVARLRERLRLSNDEMTCLDAAARLVTTLRARAYRLDLPALQALVYREGPASASLIFSLAGAGAALNEVLQAASAVRSWPVPAFALTGADVLARGVAAGPQVGAILAEAERRWISAGFPAAPDALAAILAASLAASVAATMDAACATHEPGLTRPR